MPMLDIPEKVSVPEINFTDKVDLDPEQTALLIIDMQNDFVKPKGRLQVESARETIDRIKHLIDKARRAGIRVIYTQDTQVEQDPEFDIWPQHCKKGTWGWQIIDELKPEERDMVIRKNRYDAFYGTALDHYLSNIWGLKNLIIVGTVANICVLHTAASAGLRWYRVNLVAEGISALTTFDLALTFRQATQLYNAKIVRRVDDLQLQENKDLSKERKKEFIPHTIE